MLDAIAASDGSRSDVISKMFGREGGRERSVPRNVLTSAPTATRKVRAVLSSPSRYYKATDKLATETVISRAQSTVNAALGK